MRRNMHDTLATSRYPSWVTEELPGPNSAPLLRLLRGKQPKGAARSLATEVQQLGGMEELRTAANDTAGALPERFLALSYI